MAENPFVRMYRDLVRRINEMPQVRLSRADPEAPAEPADGWALSVGRQRVALGAAPTPPPIVHIATSTPTASAATGRQLGTLWIRRQGGTLAGAWVLTGATTWTPVTWTDATLAALSLAKLTDGELSAGVRDSLRTQLDVPTPPVDTDWTPLTLDAGFTGGAWWCVRGGVVYLHGRVTRDAGNWPTDFTPFATLPAAARPSYPSDAGATYHPLTALNGDPLTFATISDGTMSARAATGTSTTHIYLHSLSWPVTP